jgi:hypothetical protein
VRPITDADIPTAVDTLARAFADYSYTRHVIAADDHEERIRRSQELWLTRIGMVIQEAERAGYPAFLESSSEANVRFYERLGFKVTADVQLPLNGPRTWCMRRDPH